LFDLPEKLLKTISEVLKAGKFFDAISYSGEWIAEGLLSEEEIENFNRNLFKFLELVEVECKENAEFMFSLYEMPKKKKVGMMKRCTGN